MLGWWREYKPFQRNIDEIDKRLRPVWVLLFPQTVVLENYSFKNGSHPF